MIKSTARSGVVVDLAHDVDLSQQDDKLHEECGVAAIPLSAFYAEQPVTNVVRLCYAKQAETIAAGLAGLVRAKAMFGA